MADPPALVPFVTGMNHALHLQWNVRWSALIRPAIPPIIGCIEREDMTTNETPPPPPRVQLTPGTWVGIAGIAATLMIALVAGNERIHDRIDDLETRLDSRVDRLAVDVAEMRGQFDIGIVSVCITCTHSFRPSLDPSDPALRCHTLTRL